MGETRVDLEHLLEDLRDAYPSSLEETILTEIIANSLDSGASRIAMTADPAQSTLTVVDNGSVMQRREMRQYHDIASSTKVRGQGIGFAGVGIKLGLLVCEEVLTETRRDSTHVATRWHLASHHRAPWHWVTPLGLVSERGTAVRLKLQTPLSPLLDPGFVEGGLRRHFQPLLEPLFDSFLVSHYSTGIALEVNGRALDRHPLSAPDQAPLAIRLARRRKPSALGYLSRHTAPLPEDQRGVAKPKAFVRVRSGIDVLGRVQNQRRQRRVVKELEPRIRDFQPAVTGQRLRPGGKCTPMHHRRCAIGIGLQRNADFDFSRLIRLEAKQGRRGGHAHVALHAALFAGRKQPHAHVPLAICGKMVPFDRRIMSQIASITPLTDCWVASCLPLPVFARAITASREVSGPQALRGCREASSRNRHGRAWLD